MYKLNHSYLHWSLIYTHDELLLRFTVFQRFISTKFGFLLFSTLGTLIWYKSQQVHIWVNKTDTFIRFAVLSYHVIRLITLQNWFTCQCKSLISIKDSPTFQSSHPNRGLGKISKSHTRTEILLFGNELFWLAWEHNPICSREPESNSPLTYPVLLIMSGLHLLS